jgi:putative ABC transport system permease protein
LIYRLVLENLKHRPVRTLLSAVFIGLQVTMILTLVGLSDGVLGDIVKRSQGTGADLMMFPPASTAFNLSGTIPEKIVGAVRGLPHVSLATGVLRQQAGNFSDNIVGINLEEFDRMSGGFQYYEGDAAHTFTKPGELLVDDEYARQKHLHVGSMVKDVPPGNWVVCGVVAQGRLSRIFTDLPYLQDAYSVVGRINIVYVKVDADANTTIVKQELKSTFPTYPVFTMQEFMDALSVNNYPLLNNFTHVVIGLSTIVGLLVVLLTMYTAVLERTREIGILKALGASPGYIMGILMREAALLAVAGTIAGIVMTYGTQAMMRYAAPTLTQATVYSWWPRAAAISLVGALIGAIYPGLKAARQDAIEALAYD